MKTQIAKSTMRCKAKLPIIAMCLSLAILVGNVPAEARSTTGFDAFRGHSNCVTESFGAAIQSCNAPMRMVFEMVVDSPGWHDIGVWDSPGGFGSFQCTAYSFSGVNNGISAGTTQTFASSGQESQNFTTFVPAGWAMALYCEKVPNGRGISILNWSI